MSKFINVFTIFLLLMFCKGISISKELIFSSEDTPLGLNTLDFPSKISDANLADCFNVWINKGSGQIKKDGLTDIGGCQSTSSRNIWTFFSSNLEEWLIRLDCRGNLIAGRSIGSLGSCFSVCVATKQLSLNEPTDSVNCLGQQWFTNKEDGLMSWDGSVFTTYPSAPLAARVSCHKNRVVLADISNEQSSVRLSGEQNGADWTNDSRYSTSPISFPVGGANAGNKVFDVFSSNNELLIFLKNSMFGLLGNDQRDFQTRLISNSIGCQFPDTIAEKANLLYFLSGRGLEAYSMASNSFTSPTISYPISGFFDPIISLGRSGRNKIFGSQTDWKSGISSPTTHITVTVNPGSIQPLNNTFTDTTETHWSSGSITNSGASVLSSSRISGSLVFTSTAQSFIQNNSFENAGNLASDATYWSVIGNNTVGDSGCTNGWQREETPTGGHSPYSGSYFINMALCNNVSTGTHNAPYGKLALFNTDNSIIISTPLVIGTTTNGWLGTRLNTSIYQGKEVLVGIVGTIISTNSGKIAESTITQRMFVGNEVSVVSVSSANFPVVGSRWGSVLLVDLASSTLRPGTDFISNFKSRSFDTQLSTPNYDPITTALAIGTVTFGIETSSDSANWGAQIQTATGIALTNDRQRYIRYASSFSVVPATFSITIQVDSVSLGSWVTGYHQTSAVDVGVNISSWGVFSVDQSLNDGSIDYQLQSSSASNFFPENNWFSQPINKKIKVGLNRYIAARVFIQTDASTSIPVTASLSFNWYEGSDPPTPIGIVRENDYHIFMTSNPKTATKNDLHLIFENDTGFTRHGGYNVSGATIQNNKLVVGDANETGRVFEVETSTDGRDRGSSFESFVKFKRVDGNVANVRALPDIALHEKNLSNGYLTISREDSDISQFFDITYQVDGGTTTYNAGTVEISTGSTLTFGKFNIPQDNSSILIKGRYFDFTVKEKTSAKGYTIQSFKLYGDILPIE